MTKKIAIIVANGKITEVEEVKARLAVMDAAFVIAVNGGSVNSRKLNLDLDVVIGDLDSLETELREHLYNTGVRIENFPALKNETDLELGLLSAVGQGARRIIILGAVGGRLDMTLANVLLLAHPRLQGVKAEVWHGAQTAWLIRPPGDDIEGHVGDTLSLIPLGANATGITTHNLVYTLDGDDLDFGPARGISNVLSDTNARVELQAGLLFAVHTPGRA